MRVFVPNVAQSQYSLIGTFADAFLARLRLLGHTVETERQGLGQVDAAFLINGIHVGPGLPSRSTTVMLIDHPMYHLQRTGTVQSLPSPLTTVICRSHVSFLAQIGASAEFLPHGALIPNTPVDGHRPIDIVLAGGGGSEAATASYVHLRDRLRASRPEFARVFESVEDRLRSNPALSAVDVLNEALRNEKLGTLAQGGRAFFDLAIEVLKLIDKHLRARHRDLLLRAFGRAGLAVDVYGKGWEGSSALEGHRFHGEVSLAQMAELTTRAKFVLHSNVFPDGSHERPLNAMASGAVAVMDGTAWFREHFSERAVLYDAATPEAAVHPVRALLGDDGARRELSESGRTTVLGAHTWAHRAEEWLAMLERRFPGVGDVAR